MEEVNKMAKCSFCGIARGDAYKLIAGPNVYICDECTKTAYHLIFSSGEPVSLKKDKKFKVLTPEEIKEKHSNLYYHV